MIRAAAALLLLWMSLVTPRWTPLRPHGVQSQLFHSPARFCMVPAGRRSGKTEIAKRKVVLAAIDGTEHFPARFFCAAPTRQQAKRIYWDDLKALVPPALLARKPLETELLIPLVNGAQIHVLGMDEPARIEGSPWDGGILDEFGNMKAGAWENNVRPALSDRRGWCWQIGVPEGRNHYYDLYRRAQADVTGEWATFSWPSRDILPPEEIEALLRDLDPLVAQQELEASFVSFEGRAYYAFDELLHCAPLAHDLDRDLVIALDFNIAPGVAAIAQEQRLPVRTVAGWRVTDQSQLGTGWIGEVWVPRASNTEIICRRLLRDWGSHRGPVHVYADATGGAGGTAQVMGSDLDLVQGFLRDGFRGSESLPGFGDRLSMRVPRENPRERTRVNAVNTRLQNGAGEVRMMVDPARAPHLVKDFEGVRTIEGGSGEIEKDRDKTLTHISDAAGYYVVARFPIDERNDSVEEWIQ